VIARNSAFAYKGRAVDARVVGKELSARYLLEGSVRKSADRLRLMAQLIDTVDGTQVWAEKFDGRASDIFDLQDQLTNKVVTSLRPHLTQAELKRSQRKRPDSLDGWDLYLRATSLYYETNRDANAQAIALLERAIDLDRNFASPYSRMSACKIQAAYHSWTPGTVAIAREAKELATRATQLDPADPLGFDALASAHVFLGENEEGLRAARRALDIDPNLSAAQGTVVSTLALLGKPDEAIAAFEQSEQNNPFDPDRSGRLMGLIIAMFGAKRYDRCAAAAREHILLRPAWYGSRVFLAAALARIQQLEEARRVVAELLALVPRFSIARAHNRPMFSDRKTFEDLIDALRTAGVPES
jgi:adenylate cyclase